MLRFDSTGRSHVGLVRGHNEDAGFAGPTLQLVADGVGGAAAGEVASATAGYVTTALALRAGSSYGPVESPGDVLRRAVGVVVEQLRAGTRADARRHGMATTLTGLLTDGRETALVHVGDSRAYLLREGRLQRLTRDDTFVQMLVDDGLLTPDEARLHPRKNVVMRCLDATGTSAVEVTSVALEPGDRLLVCSDGLTDLIDDQAVQHGLGLGDPDESADWLVVQALDAGGIDNITCLVADVVDAPRLQPDGLRLGALTDPGLVVDPAAVHAPSA